MPVADRPSPRSTATLRPARNSRPKTWSQLPRVSDQLRFSASTQFSLSMAAAWATTAQRTSTNTPGMTSARNPAAIPSDAMISAAATVGSTRTPWSATWPIVARSPAPIRRTAWTYSAEISGPTIAESISARIRKAETLSLPWPNGVAPVAARTISSYGATTPSARTANSSGWRRYSPSASVMIWRIERGVCSWGGLIAEAYASRG